MSPYWMLVPLIPPALILIVDWRQNQLLRNHEERLKKLEQPSSPRWRTF